MTEPTRSQRRLGVRLLVSVGVGSLVCVTAVVAAWLAHGAAIPLSGEEGWLTSHGMRELAGEVSSFREANGRLPATLEELIEAIDPEAAEHVRFDDGWDHPLKYSVTGDAYTIVSLGRDHRAGGVGLDCDLTWAADPPPEAFPPLEQFLFEMDSSRMIDGCIGCGVLAALAALVALRPPDLTREGIISLATKLTIVTLAATILAVFMTALEIPMGSH